MNNYPKVRAAVRMPDGTTLEVVETPDQLFTLRNKNTLERVGMWPINSFTRAIGEIYGRVKAMEEKIEKAKKENKQYCANCQCLLEL